MRHLLPALTCVDGAMLPDLAVSIDGDRIAAVGPAAALRPAPDDVIERLPRAALLPGFVNAHSHAFQRGLRGHVQYAEGGDSFWTWRERMYALATSLDPDGVEQITARAFEEMLRAGFTTVGEFHYLHHQPDGAPYADPDELALRVAAAAERVGIRLVLLRVAYARAGHGVADNPRQRRFLDRSPDAALAAVERLRARGVHAGLAPHSVRACPADWLRAFAVFDGPIHAHVDEQSAEIAASLAEHGRRPLHVFADAGLVHERFTAVHLTHPDDDEIATLRAAGGAVCACPTTELDLGDGFLPAGAASSRACITRCGTSVLGAHSRTAPPSWALACALRGDHRACEYGGEAAGRHDTRGALGAPRRIVCAEQRAQRRDLGVLGRRPCARRRGCGSPVAGLLRHVQVLAQRASLELLGLVTEDVQHREGRGVTREELLVAGNACDLKDAAPVQQSRGVGDEERGVTRVVAVGGVSDQAARDNPAHTVDVRADAERPREVGPALGEQGEDRVRRRLGEQAPCRGDRLTVNAHGLGKTTREVEAWVRLL